MFAQSNLKSNHDRFWPKHVHVQRERTKASAMRPPPFMLVPRHGMAADSSPDSSDHIQHGTLPRVGCRKRTSDWESSDVPPCSSSGVSVTAPQNSIKKLCLRLSAAALCRAATCDAGISACLEITIMKVWVRATCSFSMLCSTRQ